MTTKTERFLLRRLADLELAMKELWRQQNCLLDILEERRPKPDEVPINVTIQ